MKRAVVTRPWRILPLMMAVAVPLTAQPNTSPARIGLGDVIQRALAANPGLRAAAQAHRAARMQARAAALTRLGRLEGVASYSKFKDDQILRPMSRQLVSAGMGNVPFDDEQFHYGVEYELPLYLGGRLNARIHVARLAAGQAAQALQGSRWQVRFNAVSLYAGAVSLDSAAQALSELEQALDRTRRRLDVMVEEGKRPEVDRLKVLDQVAEVQAQRAQVAADSARVRGLLAAVLDLPAADSLSLAPLPEALPRLGASPAQLREALAQASVVRRADLAARQAHAAIGVARADFLPSIAARANAYEHDGPDIQGGALSTWQVSVGARLPLFTGGTRLASMSAARAKARAADAQLAQTRLQQEARLEAALAHFRSSRTAADAAHRRRQAADEAARIEQIRYDTGAGTIEDLLRARSRQQAAHAQVARAIGDVWIAAEQINTLVEKEIVR